MDNHPPPILKIQLSYLPARGFQTKITFLIRDHSKDREMTRLVYDLAGYRMSFGIFTCSRREKRMERRLYTLLKQSIDHIYFENAEQPEIVYLKDIEWSVYEHATIGLVDDIRQALTALQFRGARICIHSGTDNLFEPGESSVSVDLFSGSELEEWRVLKVVDWIKRLMSL